MNSLSKTHSISIATAYQVNLVNYKRWDYCESQRMIHFVTITWIDCQV